MSRYHLLFRFNDGETTREQTRIVSLSAPIEYDSDIVDLQNWAAQDQKAESAVLLNWRPLVGEQRPLSPEQQAKADQRQVDAQALADDLASQAEPRSKKARVTLAASLATLYAGALAGEARPTLLLTGVLQGLQSAGKLSEAQHAAQVERLQQLSRPAVAA